MTIGPFGGGSGADGGAGRIRGVEVSLFISAYMLMISSQLTGSCERLCCPSGKVEHENRSALDLPVRLIVESRRTGTCHHGFFLLLQL